MAVDEAERAEVLQGPVVAPHLVRQPEPRLAQANEAGRAPASVLRSVVELAVGAGAIMGRE